MLKTIQSHPAFPPNIAHDLYYEAVTEDVSHFNSGAPAFKGKACYQVLAQG